MNKLKFLMVAFIFFVYAFVNVYATNESELNNSINYTNNNTKMANELNRSQNISNGRPQLSTMDFHCDRDKDGFISKESNCSIKGDVDCDDNNPSIHPNATEICNGIDDNCNNKTDNDEKEGICPLLLYYCDKDRDGFIASLPSGNCSKFNCIPSGCKNESEDDCDDNNTSINTIANMKEVILKYDKTKEMNLMVTKMENSKNLIVIVSMLVYFLLAFSIIVVLSWIVFREKFHH